MLTGMVGQTLGAYETSVRRWLRTPSSNVCTNNDNPIRASGSVVGQSVDHNCSCIVARNTQNKATRELLRVLHVCPAPYQMRRTSSSVVWEKDERCLSNTRANEYYALSFELITFRCRGSRLENIGCLLLRISSRIQWIRSGPLKIYLPHGTIVTMNSFSWWK